MADLTTRIIRKVIPQQKRRCPACKRTLQQAIEEQIASQQNCAIKHCAFKIEIGQAFKEAGINIIPSFVSKYCDKCGRAYDPPSSNYCSKCGKKRCI